jgi:hypothetical protein
LDRQPTGALKNIDDVKSAGFCILAYGLFEWKMDDSLKSSGKCFIDVILHIRR